MITRIAPITFIMLLLLSLFMFTACNNSDDVTTAPTETRVALTSSNWEDYLIVLEIPGNAPVCVYPSADGGVNFVYSASVHIAPKGNFYFENVKASVGAGGANKQVELPYNGYLSYNTYYYDIELNTSYKIWEISGTVIIKN